MLAHVTGPLLTLLVLATDPAPPPPGEAPPPPATSPAPPAPVVTPLGRVAFEGGLGGGVTSAGFAAPMLEGAVLLLLADRIAFGVVASGDPIGFSERQGAQTAGPPGSFRFSMPELYAGVALGLRRDFGGRFGELLLEVGAHQVWLAPEDWDDDVDVEGGAVLPYLGARALVQVVGPVAVGAAVRADLMRRDLEATTRDDGTEREWDVGRAGGVSALGFVAFAFDLSFGRER